MKDGNVEFKANKKKKTKMIIAGVSGFFVILAVVLIIVLTRKKEPEVIEEPKPIEEVVKVTFAKMGTRCKRNIIVDKKTKNEAFDFTQFNLATTQFDEISLCETNCSELEFCKFYEY